MSSVARIADRSEFPVLAQVLYAWAGEAASDWPLKRPGSTRRHLGFRHNGILSAFLTRRQRNYATPTLYVRSLATFRCTISSSDTVPMSRSFSFTVLRNKNCTLGYFMHAGACWMDH
jgi:hypothetical protein